MAKTCFQMATLFRDGTVQKRRNEHWRSSSFWAPVNKSYWQECRKNSRKNHRGSSVHNWRDLRSYKCELEFLSADFDHGFEHETLCSEVCSPPAHTGPKKHLFDFVPGVEKSDWNLVPWVRPWDQTSFRPMEDAHFTETEKSKTSEVKCEKMLIVFFNVRGIVHREFVPPGQPVNQ